jgi:hypothetical protein
VVSIELVDDYWVIHIVEFYVGEWDGFCVPLRTLWQDKKKHQIKHRLLTFCTIIIVVFFFASVQ